MARGAMESVKFHMDLPCLTLLRPELRAGHLMAVSGLACPQGGRPTAVFYPLGHSTLYAYAGARRRSAGEA
jgi:hypothetical protein